MGEVECSKLHHCAARAARIRVLRYETRSASRYGGQEIEQAHLFLRKHISHPVRLGRSFSGSRIFGCRTGRSRCSSGISVRTRTAATAAAWQRDELGQRAGVEVERDVRGGLKGLHESPASAKCGSQTQ